MVDRINLVLDVWFEGYVRGAECLERVIIY